MRRLLTAAVRSSMNAAPPRRPLPASLSPLYVVVLLLLTAAAACHSSPRRAPPVVDSSLTVRQRDCASGDYWSCTLLGFAYQRGDEELHVPVDWKLGAEYFNRACAVGRVPEACLLLSQMYELGGVNLPADLRRAAAALRVLCDEGHTEYCTREPRELPYAYRGDGVNPDRPTP